MSAATPLTSSGSCPSCYRVAKYGDFAKPVSDFFSKDFPSGLVKLEARSQSRSLLVARPGKTDTFSDEFKVSAARDLATGTIAAEVKNTTVFPLNKTRAEAKSVTTLTSNNLLTQQLIISNAVLEGLKLEVTGTLQPSGANSTKACVELNQGCLLSTSTVDVLRGPILTTDLATRFRDFQLGGEIGYDASKGTLEKYSVAIGFDRPREKAVIQALTGFKTFTGLYFQKVNEQLEVACRASWNSKVSNVSMEVGAKWYMLGGGFLKAKVDNIGRLGLALASDLRPGVQVILGATIDTAKLNENAHKLGLELTYSA